MVNVNGEDVQLFVEQISAQILKKLKESAEIKIRRKVKYAVVTVPAYFNDLQKQATRDACTIAGLDCKFLLPEPSAAAIAYGFDKPHPTLKKCVVFDFGGGTLDVSVLSVFRREIKILAVSGDDHLGGQDID